MTRKFPWRTGESISDIIQRRRELLVKQNILMDGPGYSQDELHQAETRIGRPIPRDIRELYQAAKPRMPDSMCFPSNAIFCPIRENTIAWHRLAEDQPHPLDMIFEEEAPEGWDNVDGFLFGGTPFFDRLFEIKGHESYQDGSIILTDHEMAFDEIGLIIVVARSLAEYLERYCYFNCVDLIAFPGENSAFPEDAVKLLQQEIFELNLQ